MRWGIWPRIWYRVSDWAVRCLAARNSKYHAFSQGLSLMGKMPHFLFNGLDIRKLSSSWESWCIGPLNLRCVESCDLNDQQSALITNTNKYYCWATVGQVREVLWGEGSLVMYFTDGSISTGKVLGSVPKAAYPTINIKCMSSLRGNTGTQNSLALRKFFLLVYRWVPFCYFVSGLWALFVPAPIQHAGQATCLK